MGKVTTVALGLVRPNAVSLRSVDRESEAFLGLIESIRSKGFMGAITVREAKDADTGTKFYELIDGLHRFTAATAAGLEVINVDILDMDEQNVYEAQLMANIHKVETKPQEYSRQLARILDANPTLTISSLAARLGRSAKWLTDRLGLAKIENAEIVRCINDGRLNLSNAAVLAKLPIDEQATWLDRGITQNPAEFQAAAMARIKELKAAKLQGRDAAPVQFIPTPHSRKLSELKDDKLVNQMAEAIINKCGIKTPVEAFKMAVQWATHMDPVTIEQKTAEFEAKETAARAEREKREQDRAAKRQAAAEKKAAEAEAMATGARVAAGG